MAKKEKMIVEETTTLPFEIVTKSEEVAVPNYGTAKVTIHTAIDADGNEIASDTNRAACVRAAKRAYGLLPAKHAGGAALRLLRLSRMAGKIQGVYMGAVMLAIDDAMTATGADFGAIIAAEDERIAKIRAAKGVE